MSAYKGYDSRISTRSNKGSTEAKKYKKTSNYT